MSSRYVLVLLYDLVSSRYVLVLLYDLVSSRYALLVTNGAVIGGAREFISVVSN